MKRGYKCAMIVGIIGFTFICYLFLNCDGESWAFFTLCGVIGAILSFIILEIT